MGAELAGPRIIVIDDDQDSREAFAMFLRMSGLRVDEFESAEKAIDSMSGDVPAVVVVDIMLSDGIDGYEAARRIRALPSAGDTRIVAMTGYSPDEVGKEGRGALFDAVFTKPANADDLLAAVKGFCP